ncbi:MAG: hypothetical protein WCQ47_05605, partial [bacterium]
DLLPTVNSDLKIYSYGKYFYRIERSNSNSIIKFSIEAPSKPIWQFSTDEAGDANSNPSAIIFVNETKAYLLRYNSTKAWIVNPSAATQSEFKIGELDLSAYGDNDGIPEMASGVIVDHRLFIALQRYDMINYGPNNISYLVVFDTNTDTKITDLPLAVRNPSGKIKYYDGYIYIPGADNMYGGTAINGGIQRVDTSTYAADPTIIAANKNISNVEIISNTKGYLVQYDAIWVPPYGKTYLKSFNPANGVIDANNVADIGNNDKSNIQDIIKDSNNLLWIAEAPLTNPGIYIVDTATDTLQEGPISTNLNPLDITFCEL